MTYYKHTKRTSFGRCPDGSEQLVSFDKATFKARNLASNNDIAAYKQSPLISTKLNSYTYSNNLNINIRRINNDLVIEKENDNSMDINIFNLSGILFKQVNTNDRTFTISIQNLTEGVYILKLSNNNQTQYLKFIR